MDSTKEDRNIQAFERSVKVLFQMDICFPAKGSSKGSNMLSINERKTTNEQMRSNCNVRSECHRFALQLSAVGGCAWVGKL